MSTIRYSLTSTYDDVTSQAVTFNEPIDTITRLRNANGFFVADVPGNGDYLYDSNDSDPLAFTDTSLFADFGDSSVALNFTGGDLGDVLITGGGNDTINGGAGNDILSGGLGTNTIDGGTGTNTLSYATFTAAFEYESGRFYGLGVDMTSGSASDNTGAVLQDSFSNIANLRLTDFEDSVDGDANNNVIEGGGSGDFLDGRGGVDTLSYAHSGAGVLISLEDRTASGGDADGDSFTNFENVLGSGHDDTLIGDSNDNTLNGNGGSDTLYGLGGNDRLVIGGAPTLVDGGDGTDFLFVRGGGAQTFTDANFSGIEAIYVSDATRLDVSGVTSGLKIVSRAASGSGLEIIGTDSADRIHAQGGNTIEGGGGGDKMFGGDGTDTFRFEAGFGRDIVYDFGYRRDHIAVDIEGVDAGDLVLRSFNNGNDTLITFNGVESANKIILRGVEVEDVRDVQSELFVFGA